MHPSAELNTTNNEEGNDLISKEKDVQSHSIKTV